MKPPTGTRLARMRQYRRNFERIAGDDVRAEMLKRARVGVARMTAVFSTGTVLGLAAGLALARWLGPCWR